MNSTVQTMLKEMIRNKESAMKRVIDCIDSLKEKIKNDEDNLKDGIIQDYNDYSITSIDLETYRHDFIHYHKVICELEEIISCDKKESES